MRFEFLPAFKGDSFLIHGGTEAEPVLILVDGGPSGTYEQHLRKRLESLREERVDAGIIEEGDPLAIDLVIVSHVDDDHINGVIDLFREVFEAVKDDPNAVPPFAIGGLWHNSFDEIVGNDEVAAEAAQFGAASFAPLVEEAEDQKAFDAGLILQSVAQGHELRSLAKELDIPINEGFGGLIRTAQGSATKRELGGITLTVVGPRPAELAELQETHDKWLEAQRKAGKPVTPTSMLQSLTDESVANLSSIVLLAESGGRTALLTGDARSDFVVKGLEEIGLMPGGSLAVDLLKMPHHGSDRNVDEDFLTRVTAPAYLFTGNGEHGNPERATFEMLAKTRPDAEMKLHLTYKVAEIDPERKHVHAQERRKELKRQSEGKTMAPGSPRPEWSDEAHSLKSFIATLPPNIQVVEPTGPIVEL
jgi:hypothetical protein